MLGGRMVWVGMSRGRFVGGRNVKVPKLLRYFFPKNKKYAFLNMSSYIFLGIVTISLLGCNKFGL